MITHTYEKDQIFCLKIKVAPVKALLCFRTMDTHPTLPQGDEWFVVQLYPVRIYRPFGAGGEGINIFGRWTTLGLATPTLLTLLYVFVY